MIPAAALTVLLLQLCLSTAAAQVTPGAGPRCPTSCGGVSVPYPFGIGDGCSWPGFNLICDRTRGGEPRLLVGTGLQVVDISLANSTVRVVDSAGQVNLTFSGGLDGNGTWGGLGAGGPYVLSSFCSINDRWTGAMTNSSSAGDGAARCSGIGCCETPIPIGRPSYRVEIKSLDSSNEYADRLPIAVRIAERGWFDGASAALLNDSPG